MKLLWLCIDALDHTHVNNWIKKLPELKHLTKRSVWGQLTPEIPYSPQSWTTQFSGFNASHHGIFSLDKQNMTVNTSVPLIWQLTSAAKIPTGVHRVPFTFPPDKDTSYMYSGWTAPYPACHPNTEDYWQYLTPVYNVSMETPDYHTSMAANKHIAIFDSELAMAKKLFVDHPVDVGIIFWSIIDKLSHNIWEWRWDESEEERVKWYKRIDRHIGEFIQLFEPEMIVISSDHGFNSRDHSDTVWHPAHMEEQHCWHTAEGFYLIYHPDVKPQQKDLSNIDLLPTIISILGWQLRYKMDGSPQIPTKSRKLTPIETPDARDPIAESIYTEEEQSIVDSRLRGLGYK